MHAPNAALLIDFDNVTMGIRSDLASELKTLLSSDIVRGKVSVQRAYADWRRYPQYIVPLAESSIDLIFAPAYGSSKKNATDIRLAIDALELVFTRPEIGTFILLSGDSDFSSLVLKLKEYGKYVIGVGIRESASDLLVQNCDEYYSYNTLAGLVNTREEESVKWDPWELASEAVQRMKRNGDVMRADRLKQVMQQIDSSFDEKNLGMSKFSRFVSEAAQRGIVVLNKMENGQFEVDLPRKDGAAAPVAAAESAAPAEAGAESGAEPRGDGEERRPRRGRRGRGGRDREGREPRGDRPPREERAAAPAPRNEQLEIGVVDHEPSAPVSAPAPVPAAVPANDGIGVAGMRLTRDEAFDLMRRAVAQAAAGGSARASAVRAAARELLGRDSESLSERNFTRILQDAHDADLIDLRRRGNDYEVAPAVAANSIADQLGAAEQANTPAPAPSAPAARGMGHRGITPRGRGKASVLPVDLLSIGVVDDSAPVASAAPAARAEVSVAASDAAAAPASRKGGARGAKTAKPAAKAAPAKAVAKVPAKPAAKKAAAKKAPARKKTAR